MTRHHIDIVPGISHFRYDHQINILGDSTTGRWKDADGQASRHLLGAVARGIHHADIASTGQHNPFPPRNELAQQAGVFQILSFGLCGAHHTDDIPHSSYRR